MSEQKKLSIADGHYPCFKEVHGLSFKMSVCMHATDIEFADFIKRDDDLNRLVDCWNACVGMENPQVEIEHLRTQPASQQSAEPVAYGLPNTMITGKPHMLMQVELEIPSDDEYGGALWQPLYTHAQPVAAIDERTALCANICSEVKNSTMLQLQLSGGVQALLEYSMTLEKERDEARAKLSAQPVSALVENLAPLVENAMQYAWNAFVSDTGCYPDDFTYHNKELSFRAGRYARDVAEELAAMLAAAPSPNMAERVKATADPVIHMGKAHIDDSIEIRHPIPPVEIIITRSESEARCEFYGNTVNLKPGEI